MEQVFRRRLLGLLRRSAGDEATLKHEFGKFIDDVRAATVDRRPYEADVRDILMAFGPSARLVEELSNTYYTAVWEVPFNLP